MTKTTPGAMRAALDFEQRHEVEAIMEQIGKEDYIRDVLYTLTAQRAAMLEALQALMDEYKRRMDGDYPGENLHQFQSAYKMARAAISAATGEGKIG